MNQNSLPELNEEMMRSLFNQGMTRHVRRQARRRVVVSSLAGVALMVGMGVRLMSPVEEKEAPIVAENHLQPSRDAIHRVSHEGMVAQPSRDAIHRVSPENDHPEARRDESRLYMDTVVSPEVEVDPIFTLECNDHNSCDHLYVAAAFDHLLNINNA